jgi:MoaA/NifB/PqqE/SkfB family radical SAM enzyme/GT2 family glycosyltransferase
LIDHPEPTRNPRDEKPDQGESAPVVSVIVPLFNAEKYLARCLGSIFQNGFEEPFEVIVVDDASTDGSAEIARRTPARVVHLDQNMGVAYSRNAGVLHARAPLLFFCDTDVEMPEGTISRVVEEFRSESELHILNLGVSTRPLSKGVVATYTAYKGGYDHWKLEKAGVRRTEITYLQTLAMAMRKDVFRTGQFDHVSYQDPGGEEFELGHRLSRTHKLWLYPAIKVDHDTKPWRDRLRANFVRCARWVPLFLRRGCRFESTTGIATPQRSTSSLLSGIALFTLLLSWLHPAFAVAAAVTLATKVWLSRELFALIARETGIKNAVLGFLFELVYESAFGAGFAWGLARHAGNKTWRAVTFPWRRVKQLRFLASDSPPHVVWFCTAVCNQACEHCFYWDNLNSGVVELTIDEIEKIARNLGHIKYLTLTGGEPSVRKDIVDCVEVFYRRNGLQQVGFHTNGMLPEKIHKISTELLRRCPELIVTMSISIDHFGEKHDRLRGAKGAYVKALETIEVLKPLRSHPNFDLCVNTVYCTDNQDQAMEIHKYFTEEVGVDHAMGLVRGKPKDPKLRNVDLDGYKKVIEHVASQKYRGKYPFARARYALDDATKAIVLNAAEHGRFSLPCTAGRKTIVLSEKGDLYPCELLPKSFGNVKDHGYDPLAMIRSDAGKAYINEIVEGKCFCSWECIQPNNLIFNPKGLAFVFRRFVARTLGLTPPAAPSTEAPGFQADPRPAPETTPVASVPAKGESG